MTEWSLRDAKNRFGEVVTAAHESPQLVTEDGKPAVVIVDAGAFERLTGMTLPQKKLMKNGKEVTFIDHLLAMPQDDGEFERAPFEARDIDL
jgi:antitoxin Phd